jgi:uncharacterized protein involved in exopolysaccharide biosynthesis
MELRRYLGILGAYRWPLLLIPAIAALVALGATYVISPRYVGTAVVQLIPEEIEPRTITLRSQDDGPSNVAIGLKDPTELLSQSIIESLSSHEVAARVTADLKLNELPLPQGWAAFKAQVRELLDDAWALLRYGYVSHKPPDQATIDRVGQSLDATLVRGSYYMEVYATWRDPQTASSMANAAVQAVLLHAREVASASAAEQRKFLDTQRLEAKKQVDAARTALLDYSSRNAIVSGVSVRSAVAALDQARAALRQNELALLDARRRLTLAKQQNGSLQPDAVTRVTTDQPVPSTSTSSRTVSPNPTYQSLQDRVSTLAQEVAALETRQEQADTTQNDQALAEARSRLAEAQQQLAATDPNIETVQESTSQSEAQRSEETTSSPNPIFQSVQRDALILEQQVGGLESQHSGLQADVQRREQDVHNLVISDGRLDALNQDLVLASDTYSRRTTEWYNALLEEARPVAPIRLINPASVPVYPAYPIKIYWALIGLAAGLAVAVVLVFVRYNTDISLRTTAEAEAVLELPLLALVPSPRRREVKPAANGARRGAKP